MQTSHGGETTTAWCDAQASHSAGAIRTLQVRMELPLFPDESWRPMGMKAEICSRSCLVLDGFNPGKWTCARANDAHQLSDFRLLQLLPDCCSALLLWLAVSGWSRAVRGFLDGQNRLRIRPWAVINAPRKRPAGAVCCCVRRARWRRCRRPRSGLSTRTCVCTTTAGRRVRTCARASTTTT